MNGARFAAVLCAAVVCTAVVSFAHPPLSVTLKYDAASSRLSIEAVHAVKDENTHYIGQVKVSLNGKEIVKQGFMKQTDKKVQRAEYTVPGLKAGDDLSAEATCNIYGSKTGTLKVQ